MKTPFALLVLSLSSCVTTNHETAPSALGISKSTAQLEASLKEPGIIELETINSADWLVDRGGLINLKNPVAVDAGLTDAPEPIHVFFHVIRHPAKGTFIVDTGVETALRDAPSSSGLGPLIRKGMHLDAMTFHQPLGEWVAKEKKLNGVFFTHLHLDHLSGARDVPKDTPVYSGPSEAGAKAFMNLFTQGSANSELEHLGAINEWAFTADPSKQFEGVIDIFGDGSVWALWVPGHTPGSTAYLVRTTSGPVLLTGDASHTLWGWEHHVEPGTFTADAAKGIESLNALETFVEKHPGIDVRLGHQAKGF